MLAAPYLMAATNSPASGSLSLDGLIETTVLESGEHGYHTFRIPASVVTKNGTVVLLAEGRKGSSSDFAAIDLLSMRSRDGGRTWSEPGIVWSEGSLEEKISIGNPTPIYDAITGRIWCVYNRDNQRVFVSYSDNEGETWVRPREITTEVRPMHWLRYWTGPGHGLQLKHGANRGRLIAPSYHLELESHEGTLESGESGYESIIALRTHMVYSDDHGQTWQIGGSTRLAAELENNPQRRLAGKWIPGEATWNGGECMIEELDDGRLYLVVRDQARYDGKKAVAWSKDGGDSWSPLGIEPQLPGPGCQSSLIRFPSSGDSKSETYLFSGITLDNRAPAKIGDGGDGVQTTPKPESGLLGRQRLALYVSTDGCQNLHEVGVVYQGAAAYSDLVVLPDGTVLCFYEGGRERAYESIRLARFKLK